MPHHEDRWSSGRAGWKSSSKPPVFPGSRPPMSFGAGPRVPAVMQGGFSLLEILLAIALIGLLCTALISTSWHLIGDRPLTPEDVFWEASRAARKAALNTEHEQRLSYEPKDSTFVVTDGSKTRTFAVPPDRDLTIDFLPVQQGNSAVLIGGQLVDTRSIPAVSFYPDGTCLPFRVQFRAAGPARLIAIDPWTCAPVLTAADSAP